MISLSLSLSLTQTHIYTHAHKHTYIHTHTHTHTQSAKQTSGMTNGADIHVRMDNGNETDRQAYPYTYCKINLLGVYKFFELFNFV